jgi:Domain of unknown function (DUF6378)
MSALDEAKQIVYNDRQAMYGDPLPSARRTAMMWSAVLGIEVTPQQVIMCMIMMKVSREIGGHNHDHIVDIAGYAENLHIIEEALAKERDA